MTLKIPGRKDIIDEVDIEVACDVAFYEAAKLAAEGVDQLKAAVKTIVTDHMEGSRPKRERKPRVISDPSSY